MSENKKDNIPAVTLKRTIDKSTFTVNVFFNEDSKVDLRSKIISLLRREALEILNSEDN